MKELFLLRGLPGSGKSTLAKSLAGCHVEADMFFMKDENGKINYYDTMDDACTTCGMYEFEDAWVMQLMYNHKESDIWGDR